MDAARQWFLEIAEHALRRISWVQEKRTLYLLFETQVVEGVVSPFQSSGSFWSAALLRLSSVKHWGLTWCIDKLEGVESEGVQTVVALKVIPSGLAHRLSDTATEDVEGLQFKFE